MCALVFFDLNKREVALAPGIWICEMYRSCLDSLHATYNRTRPDMMRMFEGSGSKEISLLHVRIELFSCHIKMIVSY